MGKPNLARSFGVTLTLTTIDCARRNRDPRKVQKLLGLAPTGDILKRLLEARRQGQSAYGASLRSVLRAAEDVLVWNTVASALKERGLDNGLVSSVFNSGQLKGQLTRDLFDCLKNGGETSLMRKFDESGILEFVRGIRGSAGSTNSARGSSSVGALDAVAHMLAEHDLLGVDVASVLKGHHLSAEAESALKRLGVTPKNSLRVYRNLFDARIHLDGLTGTRGSFLSREHLDAGLLSARNSEEVYAIVERVSAYLKTYHKTNPKLASLSRAGAEERANLARLQEENPNW